MKHILRSLSLLILLSFCIAFPIWNFNYLKNVEENSNLGLDNIQFSAYIENHSNTFLFQDLSFYRNLNKFLNSEGIGMVYMSTGDGSPKVAVYGDLTTIKWIPAGFNKNTAYNLTKNADLTSLIIPHNIHFANQRINIPNLYDGISYMTWLENDHLTTGEYYFTANQILSELQISKLNVLFEDQGFTLSSLKLKEDIFEDQPLLIIGIFLSFLAIILYGIRLIYELMNFRPLLQQYWLYYTSKFKVVKYFICSIAILPLGASLISCGLIYIIDYSIFKSIPIIINYATMFTLISLICITCNLIVYSSYIHFVYRSAERI